MPEQPRDRVSVALVGYGYWGPNLARNFSRLPECELVAICDSDPERADMAKRDYPYAKVSSKYEDILDDDSIRAVLIATPVMYHYELARRALVAGKDILVEKPLTSSSRHAEELVNLADQKGCVLAVDHTFLYTGAVKKIAEIVHSGELGSVVYIDSVRINLGLFQHDVNVIWDLAPHDLSIITHLFDRSAVSAQAVGIRYGSNRLESVAYTHLEYDNEAVAHCHFNWVSPVKIRRVLITGTEKMIVYDDMEQNEKVKVFDKGIVLVEGDRDSYDSIRVGYRTGDIVAPNIPVREALEVEAEHFLECVRTRAKPLSDGQFGLNVVRQLEACQQSLDNGGTKVRIPS